MVADLDNVLKARTVGWYYNLNELTIPLPQRPPIYVSNSGKIRVSEGENSSNVQDWVMICPFDTNNMNNLKPGCYLPMLTPSANCQSVYKGVVKPVVKDFQWITEKRQKSLFRNNVKPTNNVLQADKMLFWSSEAVNSDDVDKKLWNFTAQMSTPQNEPGSWEKHLVANDFLFKSKNDLMRMEVDDDSAIDNWLDNELRQTSICYNQMLDNGEVLGEKLSKQAKRVTQNFKSEQQGQPHSHNSNN